MSSQPVPTSGRHARQAPTSSWSFRTGAWNTPIAPTALQRQQASALIAAGADVILGSHPHWAGAIEDVGNDVVLYSLGDFIFDLPRSEQTTRA